MKRFLKIDKDLNIKPHVIKEKNDKSPKNKLALVNYQEIGYYIIAPLIVGVFLGLRLDEWLKTKFFVLVFIFLGSIFSFYNLYKLYKDGQTSH